ncbi:MAG TPA: hypothetical protein PLG59_00240 [bacterium]|nr:hypothetical protein [bacterium]HQO33058.1 hypothetical protein [bacterium]
MAFTNETLVRQRGLMRLFDEVPSDLVSRCIDTAHLRVTDAIIEVSEIEPPLPVVEAETDLAMAEIIRLLAVSREINQQPYRTPEISLESKDRAERYLALASLEELQAWSRLQPYLKNPSPLPWAMECPR